MRIYDNGTYRDMTPTEIAKNQAVQAEVSHSRPLTTQDKINILLASIPEEPMPTMEPKLGYKWQPMYTPSNGFAWELVEDPAALGTVKNPWYWAEDLKVKLGHHYTKDGTELYMAIAEGIPSTWPDENWFMKIN